jgi:ubiquinone/menaquinone biosynthesis C-methylase UbiE
MSNAPTDAAFSGAIPKIYEQFLVPLIFQFYADDLAKRVAARTPTRALELAAGTGVLTRALADRLSATTTIVATDLNQAMINEASSFNMPRTVEWRQADAMQLPFEDESFDVVACQFGVMFFPDKPKAYAEVRRVLRTGGTFLFSAWGSLDDNEIADAVSRALSAIYPNDPPSFLQRTPYGYHSHKAIRSDLEKGGFVDPELVDLKARARAPNAHAAAVGFCQGIPLRAEIEAREPAGLGTTTVKVADALARKFGRGAIDTKMQAVIVQANHVNQPR